jgi:hypothetical protein
MSNVIYIDANRANSLNQQGNTNEFTYKLNTELELPKGTQIEIQNTFINLKGITGGSMEITEDITERYSYLMYITEQAHFAPLNHWTNYDTGKSWYRSTLGVGINGYYNNFNQPAPATAIADIFMGGGSVAQLTTFFGANSSFFEEAGGCNQILPEIEWVSISATDATPAPKIRQGYIHIPKGIYGIGQIGQLIQDQFNGIINYDINTNSLIYKEDVKIREQNDALEGNVDVYDGQPYNRPFQVSVNVEDRNYDGSNNLPSDPAKSTEIQNNTHGFVNMEFYNRLIDFNKKYGPTNAPNPEGLLPENRNNFLWSKINGATNPPLEGINNIAWYYFRTNFCPAGQYGNFVGTQFAQPTDPDETLNQYNLYPYTPRVGSGGSTDIMRKPTRIIGTSNFSFKYDEEKSAFSINGLHNAIRSSSHDRFGGKISSSGQTVINLKKISGDFLNNTAFNATVANQKLKQKIIGALNKPETRDTGVMIHNFALDTAIRLGNKDLSLYAPNQDHPDYQLLRFEDFFITRDDAIKAWETTIWKKMGFDYDDISNPDKFEKQTIFNKGYFPNYGFTTDSIIDSSIPSSVSTLNNPLEFTGLTPAGKAEATKTSGLQMYNLNRMAFPSIAYNSNTKIKVVNQGAYASGLYSACSIAPVIIADVGGVIARRLPTLSTHAYFLITSDICDNYKDNVKKGDVLPLLGVVPKSSLSNQDFIVAQNQITQVLSQTKVINKVHIKILNPDLTAPELDSFSSVILKITLPFKTPEALLQEEAPKVYSQITSGMETF